MKFMELLDEYLNLRQTMEDPSDDWIFPNDYLIVRRKLQKERLAWLTEELNKIVLPIEPAR